MAPPLSLQARLVIELIGISVSHVNVQEFLESNHLIEGPDTREGEVQVECINGTSATSASITICCPLSVALKLEKVYSNKQKKYLNHGMSQIIH